MQKYGSNPKFREFMMEFSGMMAGHFNEVADKEKALALEKKRQEEEFKNQDPIYNLIQNDPQVKEHLADPKVMKVLAEL